MSYYTDAADRVQAAVDANDGFSPSEWITVPGYTRKIHVNDLRTLVESARAYERLVAVVNRAVTESNEVLATPSRVAVVGGTPGIATRLHGLASGA